MAKKDSEYNYKSIKKNFTRIMLTMKNEKGEKIKAAAADSNKSLNAFILDIVLPYIDENEKAPAIQELSKNQKDIIRLFDKLSPKEQKLAFQIISLLAEGDID